MATSTSNPLAGLQLIGAKQAAEILGLTPSALTMQALRGRFTVEPVITTMSGRRYWDRNAVLRAAELLRPTETAPAAAPAK